MLGALADDQDHFGFVVERLGHLGAHDRRPVRHQRSAAAHEDGRELRNIVALRALFDVFEIIQAEADDFSGPAHGQPVGQTGERLAGARWRALGEFAERLHIPVALGEPVAEIGRRVAIGGLQVDHLIALDNAKPRPALPFERNNFHDFAPPRSFPAIRRAATITAGFGTIYCCAGQMQSVYARVTR